MKISILKPALSFCAIALLAFAGTATAEESKSTPKYVTFGLQYMEPDALRGADFGIGFNGSYASRLSARRWWEFRVSSTTIETGAAGSDFYNATAGFDLIQEWGNISRGHPIGIIGVGGTFNDVTPDTEDGTGGYANVGLGWRFEVMKDWGFRPRLEARATYDTFADGVTDYWVGFAFEIPPKRVEVRERIVEKVVVEEKIVEVPVEVIKEVPMAPSDSDGDGIPDPMDKCPGTLQGAAVGPDGCVRKQQSVNLPNIEFEPGKAVLTGESKRKLVDVLQFLRNQSNVTLEIFGHTDSQGRDEYNLQLSEQRAKSVVEFLVEEGVEAGRLQSKGMGETAPIASNETAAGRAENRRVELRISASD